MSVAPSASTQAAQNDQFGVRPLSPVMGAEVTGIDLSAPLSADRFGQIHRAFLEHKLLVFRGQTLSRDQILGFAGRFGPIEGHNVRGRDGQALDALHSVSNVDANGELSRTPHINANYYWHSDKAHYEVPSLLTLLYAVELPPNGGETEFANMERAYRALPDPLRTRADPLRVINDFEYAMVNAGKVLNEAEKVPSVTHPMVRTHPETGARSLYIGMYTKGVVGMPEPEAQSLVAELMGHATQPEHLFRHPWQLGDVVIWDNRCLVHRAVKNFEITRFRRVLLRCVVKGSRAV